MPKLNVVVDSHRFHTVQSFVFVSCKVSSKIHEILDRTLLSQVLRTNSAHFFIRRRKYLSLFFARNEEQVSRDARNRMADDRRLPSYISVLRDMWLSCVEIITSNLPWISYIRHHWRVLKFVRGRIYCVFVYCLTLRMVFYQFCVTQPIEFHIWHFFFNFLCFMVCGIWERISRHVSRFKSQGFSQTAVRLAKLLTLLLGVNDCKILDTFRSITTFCVSFVLWAREKHFAALRWRV